MSSSRTLDCVVNRDEICIQHPLGFNSASISTTTFIPPLLPEKFTGDDSPVFSPEDVPVSEIHRFQVCGYAYSCCVLEAREKSLEFLRLGLLGETEHGPVPEASLALSLLR